MARARNIKPAFFSNEELVELSFATRLLFIGLWTIADRDGRLEDRPKRIKMDLFPADNLDIDAALNELQGSGFLLRYIVEGSRYIQVLTFGKHQNPHKDEKQSTIPAPCKHRANTVQESFKDSGNRADSLNPDSLNPDSPKPDPLLSDSEERAATTSTVSHGDDDFEKVWAAYPKRPGASKPDSLKAWKARIAKGSSASEIMDGVIRYAAYVKATATDPQFIKQPATFFGPGDHYKSDWVAQPRASPYQTPNEKAKEWADRLTGANRHEQRPDIIDITPSDIVD